MYFIGLTLFMFFVGGLQVALFSHLSEELSARNYLSGKPSLLGTLSPEDIE